MRLSFTSIWSVMVFSLLSCSYSSRIYRVYLFERSHFSCSRSTSSKKTPLIVVEQDRTDISAQSSFKGAESIRDHEGCSGFLPTQPGLTACSSPGCSCGLLQSYWSFCSNSKPSTWESADLVYRSELVNLSFFTCSCKSLPRRLSAVAPNCRLPGWCLLHRNCFRANLVLDDSPCNLQ